MTDKKKVIVGYNFVALLNYEISAHIQMAITLFTTYYLQMFWHDMKLKLTLEILLLNEVGQVTWILLKSSSGLYNTKCQIAKLHNVIRPNFNFIACVEVDIPSKKFPTKKVSPLNVM